uniref:Methylisocitrate lyase n=2 Tax=Candidatus Berkiella aquae TaxID=295108 RepID=A0A0Q9YU52_9GAMM
MHIQFVGYITLADNSVVLRLPSGYNSLSAMVKKEILVLTEPGQLLRQAIQTEKPLQIVGTIHAYAARLAEASGHKALYLSGAGVANSRLALPDLAMTSLDDVVTEVTKITQASTLPLLVDADTGWGSPLNIRRTFSMLSKAGAAGAHIEDQTEAKRCGHRSGKKLVSTESMVGKIKAALDGRNSDSFMVMARTDAFAVEGLQGALERARTYEAAGADAIFVEALDSLDHYLQFTRALTIPVLANITEFGKTPLFSRESLAKVGVSMILYPLSAFRAMNQAALKVYEAILQQGTQQSVIPLMQTRDELYQYLQYENYEKELDEYNQLMEREDANN